MRIVRALAALVLGGVFASAQSTLEEWRTAARELHAPPAQRIDALTRRLREQAVTAADAGAWLDELGAQPSRDPDRSALAAALARTAARGEVEAELRLDMEQAALAEGDCERARELLEALDGVDVGAWRSLVEVELAQIARLTHAFARAEQHVARALESLGDAHDAYSSEMRLHALGERALLDLDLGRIDHAARGLREIERRRAEFGPEQDGSTIDLAMALWTANLFVAQDDHRGAVELCDRWLESGRATPLSSVARALIAYRRAYARVLQSSALATDLEVALDELRAALAAPELSALDAWRGWIEAARAELRRGNRTAAREALAQADARLDVRDGQRLPRARRSSLALALAVSEAAHGDELTRARAEFDADWRATLDEWRDAPRWPGGIGLLHSASSLELLCDLTDASVALHGAARGAELAVDEVLKAQATGSFALEVAAPAGDLATARACLLQGDDHGLLLFVLAPARSLAFAIDREGVSVHELRGRLLLRDVVARTQRDATDRTARAAAYSAFFPGGLPEWLGRHSRLTLVGAEQLGATPFERFTNAADESLGATHALDFLPSIPIGVWLARRDANADAHGAAVLAVTAPDALAASKYAQVKPFSFDAGDCGRMLEAWSGDCTTYCGAAIGLDAYDDAVARSPFVVQWLTHGVFDPNFEPPAGLALGAAPGVAWSADFAARRAPPVVLLSSCGAARTPLRRGDDGSQQLSSAFFRAGAQCVVAASTAVQLSSAERFARALHEALAEGVSVAEAARRARQRLEREGEDSEWSEWQVFGLGDTRSSAPSRRPSPSGRLRAIVLGAALLVLLVWSARRRSKRITAS